MKRAAAVVLALLACGEVAPPPSGIAPLNSCTSQSDCEKFATVGSTCTKDGICAAPGKLSFTLVVTIPTTSNYAPGETVFLPPAYLNDLFVKQKVPASCGDRDTTPKCTCVAPKCLFMPQNGEQQGTFRIPRVVAAENWPWAGCASSALTPAEKDKFCGLRPNDANPYTSLPAHVVFRPLWPVDTTFAFASTVGIPVQDIDAELFQRQSADKGPNGTTGTQYDVLLQAGSMDTGVGWYVRRADPPPPFESAFPPMLRRMQVSGVQGAPQFDPISLDGLDAKPETRTFTLSTKGPSLAGWRVYLAARGAAKSFDYPVVDGERLSTVTTIANPAGEMVSLHTALSIGSPTAIDSVLGMRLVIEPPPNQALPTFAIDDVAGQILPTNQEIPALPPPVQVSGAATLEGRGRQSHVTFESLHDPDGAIELADGTFSSALSYRTTIETDATGAYSVHLPPGKYGVYVVPLAADSAKTVLPYTVGSKEINPQGRALALWPKTHVHATVSLGDDRPVGGAQVMFYPALNQPMGTNPLALPRPALARTVLTSATEAVFDIDVDPGIYDITVAPLAGTKFPWFVRTASTITQMADLAIDPFVIPPPIQQGGVVPGLTIRDPSGNAIVGAIVEVYAALSPMNTGSLSLVGRVISDSNGHFDLHLAGAPNK